MQRYMSGFWNRYTSTFKPDKYRCIRSSRDNVKLLQSSARHVPCWPMIRIWAQLTLISWHSVDSRGPRELCNMPLDLKIPRRYRVPRNVGGMANQSALDCLNPHGNPSPTLHEYWVADQLDTENVVKWNLKKSFIYSLNPWYCETVPLNCSGNHAGNFYDISHAMCTVGKVIQISAIKHEMYIVENMSLQYLKYSVL